MDFDEYQSRAKRTAVFPSDKSVEYLSLKLASEAGEVAGKIAKSMRGDYDDPNMAGSILYDKLREDVGYELGDNLWYLSELARAFNYTFSEIAEMNLQKINDRFTRGVTKGSGDKR